MFALCFYLLIIVCCWVFSFLKGTSFQRVIGDSVCEDGERVKRVVLCSGKIYYELMQERKKKELDDTVAIIRVEQV